jgi:hypothetical protein
MWGWYRVVRESGTPNDSRLVERTTVEQCTGHHVVARHLAGVRGEAIIGNRFQGARSVSNKIQIEPINFLRESADYIQVSLMTASSNNSPVEFAGENYERVSLQDFARDS